MCDVFASGNPPFLTCTRKLLLTKCLRICDKVTKCYICGRYYEHSLSILSAINFTKWLRRCCASIMSIRPLFFYFLVYGCLGGKNGSVGRKKIKNNFFSKGSIMSSCRKKLPVHGNSNKKWCFKKLLNTLNIIKVVTQNYSNISKRNKGNI